MQRRRLLKVVTAGAFISAAPVTARTDALKPTRRDAQGPFYPIEPIPLADSLLLNNSHQGEKLTFKGRVLSSNGDALSDCRVEIWQCDANSVYRHPRATDQDQADVAFRGFGASITNDAGEYQFDTIVPVPYPGRPPHIHIKVFVAGDEQLTTQVYLEGHRGPKSLKMALEESNEEFEATFDIVL